MAIIPISTALFQDTFDCHGWQKKNSHFPTGVWIHYQIKPYRHYSLAAVMTRHEENMPLTKRPLLSLYKGTLPFYWGALAVDTPDPKQLQGNFT